MPKSKIVKELVYPPIIEKVFFDNYKKGANEVHFTGTALKSAYLASGLKNADNVPDVLYYYRFRYPMPDRIKEEERDGKEWVILLNGRKNRESYYKFKLLRNNRIIPNQNLVTIKIPDSTPEIVTAYAQSDEQALLAKVRYNRLIDVFLGVTTYSLQNHLRTSVKKLGQIEIDEIYVGVDKQGRQFVIPVQAKGGKDQVSIVQVIQDLACCEEKFPALVCRAISAQFMSNEKIALFELTMEDEEIHIVEERHYKLVPSREITEKDLKAYSARAT